MKRGMAMFLAAAVLAATLCDAAAQDAKDQIRERMRSRYPALVKAKTAGAIGETALGFVEIVSPKDAADETLKKLAEAENADRKQLYEIIAADTKTTAEAVGKHNALRLFEKAAENELFKGEDGKWRAKKDLKPKQEKQ